MSSTTAIPRPPAIAQARQYYAMFAGTIVIAALGAWAVPSTAPLALALALIGGVFPFYAHLLGRDAWGEAYAAAAQQALTRGRFDEVEALHAKVPAHSLRRGSVARTVAVQKALVALFRGSPEGAIAALGPAVASETRFGWRQVERMHMAGAFGVRALAYAMTGDAARAEADAAATEAIGEALPAALARARLARRVILSRSGDMTALASELAKDGSLLLEHTMPRERALVRALRKMARGRGRSVYREPSKPSDAGNDPGALASWIAQVAPEAAAYAGEEVGRAVTSAEAAAPVASPEALRAVGDARRVAIEKVQSAPNRSRFANVGAGLGLVAMLCAVWWLVGGMSAPAPSRHRPEAAMHVDAFDLQNPILAVLAVVAIASLVMSPLLGLRGLALAALGRRGEAEAELASLLARFPGYSHLALADFRIRLVNAVRSGDLDAARALAQQRTAELPLPLRDDLLADLVLATGTRGLPKEEMDRVAAELRDDAEVCAWIDAIAPRLRDRLGGAIHGGVRVSAAAETEDAHDARVADDDAHDDDAPAVVRRATLDS
ncbi:MAG: hypothetical protein QOI41_1625 [Myxococcales bacterium]|nr:hypothetical protein [Myxococcales bacterium]